MVVKCLKNVGVWWLWVDCGQAQDQPLRYVKWRDFRLYIKSKNNKKTPVGVALMGDPLIRINNNTIKNEFINILCVVIFIKK